MVHLRILALCAFLSSAVSFVTFAPVSCTPSFFSDAHPQKIGFRTIEASRSRRFAATALSQNTMRMSLERTYIMIKPDGVQRGLVSDIVGRFEKRGYQLKALKLVQPTKAILEEHYSALKGKGFFPKLVEYMLSGPVVAMVWEGKDVVAVGRKMLGATNPLESAPGTIRGDFAIEVGRNICHGSDSVESANREIGLWFKPEEVVDWPSHSHDWIYE